MGADWKREKVQDHKFDFINVDDFIDNSCWRQFRYMLVFLIIIRGILVYCSDVFTAVNLMTNQNPNYFAGTGGNLNLGVAGLELPLAVYKYLFTGCIILGLLLLLLDIRRANGIIRSRDISYAFTSQIASRYYTVRSYPHYCFFSEINNSKKFVDNVAFFVFFTFRNWKRLLLADAPRQIINLSLLYQTFRGHFDKTFFDWDVVVQGDIFKKLTIGAMMFTVTVFVFNMLSFIAAAVMYIPLVSHIQGNLKEYCCFKIDKRIDELIKKNTKERANAAAKSKSSKGGKDIAMDYMGQPTLPQVDLLESAHTSSSAKKPTMPPPRNAYAKGQSYGQHQQQDYDYGYGIQGGYNPSPQQPGYTQNYGHDDYFQAKPAYNNSNGNTNYQQQQSSRGGGGVGGKGADGGFDPYAESAFTTDDAYDHYSGSQDQLHSQKLRNNDYYNNNSAAKAPRSVGNSGGGGGKYDDYSHLRSASPLPSQHGSDLDSNHYSNSSSAYGHGGQGGGYGNAGGQYNNSNNGGYYRNNSHSTTHGGGGTAPQRPRRNDGQGSNNNQSYRGY
ncbi:hypothetical protein BGZ95_001662 [Linnemannia exigua]|uniref:Vacuole protein n=1 Tax=Linnemannia exigua TaxID=604196 RepID=A0AAD4H8P8_9FUNG|nr:hypothetical protein BGZ95_001662 [Linnemannia exigua]